MSFNYLRSCSTVVIRERQGGKHIYVYLNPLRLLFKNNLIAAVIHLLKEKKEKKERKNMARNGKHINQRTFPV